MKTLFITCVLACFAIFPIEAQQSASNPDADIRSGTFRFDISIPSDLLPKESSILEGSPACPDGNQFSSITAFLREAAEQFHKDHPDDDHPRSYCHMSKPYVSVSILDAMRMGNLRSVEEWITVADVKEGARLAIQIREQSKQATPRCEKNDCTLTVSSISQPRAYFLCGSDRETPIPRSCRPVLLESSSGPLLLSTVGYEYNLYGNVHGAFPLPASGSLDSFFPGSTKGPTIQIHSQKKISDKKIRAAITYSLAQPQLNLQEGPSPFSEDIEATGGERKSSINPGVWEMIQVRAQLHQWDPKYVSVEYEAYYWVSDQNTEREVDWHLPTSAQLKRVTEEIDRNLRAGLCSSVSWSGSTLMCNP